MSIENDNGSEIDRDGDKVNDETDKNTKEKDKSRSVSFNRDVHVKRFGKPRETGSAKYYPPIRKEPFTHLPEDKIIEEANKVRLQANSIECTTNHSPEKFYSLPNRKKIKEEKSNRRDDNILEPKKAALARSVSDVSGTKKSERVSLSTLFRRAQKNKSLESPVVVTSKPAVTVTRSKSDVSDLKSSNKIVHIKPSRKRAGSESEEFLKSLRRKTQLSPIIESSPKEDYFQNISPLDIFQKENVKKEGSKTENNLEQVDINKVNPVEKPPRCRSQETEQPKPPARSKKAKLIKKNSPDIIETPKRKTDYKKTLLVDEIDSFQQNENKPAEIKSKILSSIRKIKENVYGTKDTLHSSQQPEKPLIANKNAVSSVKKILEEEKFSPPPDPHLISLSSSSNVNQPFSYTKPSISPDPKLFIRNTSPTRDISPVNKMNSDRGVVYAHVIRDKRDNDIHKYNKQTVHKTYTPPKEKMYQSDEDEGLGYEEKSIVSKTKKQDINLIRPDQSERKNDYLFTNMKVKPPYREYKLTNQATESIYSKPFASFNSQLDRGQADGMDGKNSEEEAKFGLDFNELSHRRHLMESRINSRKFENNQHESDEPYLFYEKDPIYEANKRMKATEKYVNETAKYCHQSTANNEFTNIGEEEFNSYIEHSDNKYRGIDDNVYDSNQSLYRSHGYNNNFESISKYTESKMFPPEPEYEPPSLEFNTAKNVLTPDEYNEKKYKSKKQLTNSHDIFQNSQKYKLKDDSFGSKKHHYASNPEISRSRESIYSNIQYIDKNQDIYHNSLRRGRNDLDHSRQYDENKKFSSDDDRDYYRKNTDRQRYDFDSRLVDSGIENDFRKGSSGDLHKSMKTQSREEVPTNSRFISNEKKHTEDNYPIEEVYANGEYLARFKQKSYHDDDEIRQHKSSSEMDDKSKSKPPKAAKKISGLEKVKQLFTRDSSKKNKKEKTTDKTKSRTRVLKSPEYNEKEESDYRRYTDPEPSDFDAKRKTEKYLSRFKGSREHMDGHRSSDQRDSDTEATYKMGYQGRYERSSREYKEEHRRHHSSDRESTLNPGLATMERVIHRNMAKSKQLDSPALAERYRERRRLATPSPTPSPPPPRHHSTPAPSGWFKSLDRFSRKKNTKIEKTKDAPLDEIKKYSPKTNKTSESPHKNLRFFGDTDPDSDSNPKNSFRKPKTIHKTQLRKTVSNSSTGLDEIDRGDINNRSYSLTNLNRDKSDSPNNRLQSKRYLHNITEAHISENDSNMDRRSRSKPPIGPYDRSRSRSSSKTLKGSKNDVRRMGRSEDRGTLEMRGSKQELNRGYKGRRRTPANSGGSSTEGESSHHSQRSVVYLHATTVGEIPNPEKLSRNRSRDDVSSVNSSNLQVRNSTKTFSILAPWTPKHYNNEVHYTMKPSKSRKIHKSSSNLSENRDSNLQKNKSYSQSALSAPRMGSSQTLNRQNGPTTLSRKSRGNTSQSSETLCKDDKLPRSISMPKDKRAGWFKMTSKNKNHELNTRMR